MYITPSSSLSFEIGCKPPRRSKPVFTVRLCFYCKIDYVLLRKIYFYYLFKVMKTNNMEVSSFGSTPQVTSSCDKRSYFNIFRLCTTLKIRYSWGYHWEIYPYRIHWNKFRAWLYLKAEFHYNVGHERQAWYCKFKTRCRYKQSGPRNNGRKTIIASLGKSGLNVNYKALIWPIIEWVVYVVLNRPFSKYQIISLMVR